MYGKGIVEAIDDLTREKFGYSVADIPEGSHKRVVAKCTRCQEQILREKRHLHKKHSCAARKVEDGVDHKWCNGCESWCQLDMFHINTARYDGLASACKECSNQPKDHTKGLFEALEFQARAAMSRAMRCGLSCDITPEYIIDLWDKQEGCCKYTRMPLTHQSGKLNTLSLDRVDSNSGYTRDNVVLTSFGLNALKDKYNYSDFLQFISQLQYMNAFYPRVECKLIDPRAKVPTRTRPEDAGYDLSAIEPVTLRPGTITNVRTGVVMSCREGYYFTIEGRSSLFKQGIFPTRGIIDATYTGEMLVALVNHSQTAYEIKEGDRVAQLITHKATPLDIQMVEEFSPEYNIRGTLGFGSSGR